MKKWTELSEEEKKYLKRNIRNMSDEEYRAFLEEKSQIQYESEVAEDICFMLIVTLLLGLVLLIVFK